MVAFRYTTVLLSALFALLCGAQTVQESWVSPSAPDYSTSIQVGETFQISWTKDLAGLFDAYAPSIDINDATLWLTSAEDALGYRVKVTDGVNVEKTDIVNWKVTIPNAQLGRSTRWVFRFAKAGTDWEVGDEEISSSPVVVKAAKVVEEKITKTTKTTTTPAAKTTDESDDAEPKTVTKTATAPKSTDDDTSEDTEDAADDGTSKVTDEQPKETNAAAGAAGNSPATEETNKEASAGLSAGAKAGIAIAVVAGVGLIAAIVFMWRRKKRLDEESAATPAYVGFPAPPTPDAGAGAGAGAESYGAQAAAAYPIKREVSEVKAYIPTNELPGASIPLAAVSPMRQPSPAVGSELSGAASYTPTPPQQHPVQPVYQQQPVQPAYQQPAGSELSGAPQQQPIPQAYQNLASELSGASYVHVELEAPYSPTPPRGNAAELR